ncbi:MAG TPA: protein kinase [Thermoanaerobaculia bacterium]|nr:protein kinase [Thermoanaerobaculia bacterium]
MSEASVPEQLGHYRIVSPLGAGGMGEVYLATDTRLNRSVAIKILPPSTTADEGAQQRMLREARMVATIEHPNVCTIYEIGTDHERPYIAMQYIQGETLGDRMRRGALTLAETIDIAGQITAALTEAHARGVVHRDIKPGNIMISSSGIVKVLDFGLAKSFLRDQNDATEVVISTAGLIVGTTPYMSPEQLRAEPLDGRSDIFSLGVVLYEIAAGKRPFDRPTAGAMIAAILIDDPPPLEKSELSALEPLILRALAKRAERRFPSASAMHEAIAAVGKRRRRAAPRRPAGSQDATTQAASAVRAPSSSSRKRVAKVHAPDPEAERLYLRGRAQWSKRHPEAVRQAIALFHEVVEIDPMHASAYAGLADAYMLLGFLQVIPPRDVIPKAKAAALRAIELAPRLAAPHASLGYIAALFDWDRPVAERELQEAMRLDPEYPWAPHWYGLVAAPKSLDEALQYFNRARDLDPLSPLMQVAVGLAHHFRRDYATAVRIYTQILDSEAGFVPAHYYIGMTYEQIGKYDEATRHLRQASEIGRGWLFRGALGHCYGASGEHDLARELLQELEEHQRERYVSPYNVMLVHLGLGNTDTAFEWLERALEERSAALWHAPVEPRLDPIRHDPRYRDLVTRYGLES